MDVKKTGFSGLLVIHPKCCEDPLQLLTQFARYFTARNSHCWVSIHVRQGFRARPGQPIGGAFRNGF